MTKPFNIHDWQAKQRQQRLTENDDRPHNWEELPGYNPDAFYGKSSLNKSKEINIDGDVERKINNFIKNMGDDLEIPLQSVVYNIIRVIKSQNYDGLEEHHEGGPLADKLKGMSANELMDFIKSQSKLRYDELEGMLEDWWGLDENTTGGGATFSDGNSMGHFGDATKKKTK